MELKLHDTVNGKIAELISEVVLTEVDDFLNLIGNANYQGIEKTIIHSYNLHPDFFDLKTKTAGEILQKFSTYNQRLAIVGDFSKIESNSLQDFIRESNRIGRIVFTNSLQKALKLLDK